MWKLIAVVMISLNGVPVDEPEHYTFPRTFDSKAECHDFDDSSAHQEALAALLEHELKEHAPNNVGIATGCIPDVKGQGV